jgi:hypothetical protein
LSDDSYSYPGPFQRRLLAALIKKPDKMRGLIEPEYFTSPVLQDIARLVISVRNNSETKSAVLSLPTLLAMTRSYLGKRVKDLWPMYRSMIKKLYSYKQTDFPVLWKEAVEFSKQAQFREAIVQAEKLVGARKYDKIIQSIIDLKSIGSTHDLGLDYWKDISDSKRWTEDRVGLVPTTYMRLLDKAMGGGVGRGELAIAEGGGKVGKSTFLGRVAAGAMWAGKNVAIASGELSAFKYRKRLDAMFSGIGYYDLYKQRNAKIGKNNAVGTKAQLEWVKKHCKGNMRIRGFPSGRARIQDVETWLDELEDDGFKTDLLVVDYLAIFKPNDSWKDKRLDLGQAAVDLRGLAMEKQVACWSAAQVNRPGLDKPMLGPTDLAEDISLFWTLDFLVALCQTKEERGTREDREAGKPEEGRIILASSRDTISGVIIKIRINRPTFSIREAGYWSAEEKK